MSPASQNPPPGGIPACLCGRPATAVMRIHYDVRVVRDMCSSVLGHAQHTCAEHAGAIVASHARPGESPITVTVTPLEASS